MNKNIIILIVAFIVVSIFIFLGNPHFAILFCIFSGAFEFNYLNIKRYANLIAEPIESASGYQMRIKHLKMIAEKASTLGFKENSVYRENTLLIPDIVCQFKHEIEPHFLTAIHHGLNITLSFCTYFEPKSSLTTCSNPVEGNWPLLPGEHIRILKTENLENLWAEHKKGVDFLKQYSFKEKDLTLEEFIWQHLTDFTDSAKNVISMKYWLIKATWWELREKGTIYCKSIQQQVQSGMIKLE